MTKTDALAVAHTLAKSKPDSGNRYEPKYRLTIKRGRVAQWRETCREFGYALCVVAHVVTEKEFYEVCEYGKD